MGFIIHNYVTGEATDTAKTRESAIKKARARSVEYGCRFWVQDTESTWMITAYPSGYLEGFDVIKRGREQRARLEYQGSRIDSNS